MRSPWTDPTGNVVLEDKESSGTLPIVHRVLRVRVATWGDGFEAWRTVQTVGGQAFVVGPLPKIPSIRISHPLLPQSTGASSFGFHTPVGVVNVELPARYNPEVVKNPWDKCRWLLVRTGLVEVGTSPLPLQASITGENPYIGRFKGRTPDEVRTDAAAVDLWLSSQPDQHAESIQILSPWLFADGTQLWRNFIGMGSTDPRSPQYEWGLYQPTGPDSFQLLVRVNGKTVLSLLPFLMDREEVWKVKGKLQHPSWRVLPLDEAEAWTREHTDVGRLTIGEDEVEVFHLLGEPLPWFWPPERVSAWAIERWL